MTLRSLLLAAAILVLGASASDGAPSERIERPGTIGLGLGAGYGMVAGDSRFGSQFDNGWGLDILIKYVLAPHWSLGLGFQSQDYEATRTAQAQGLDKLRVTTVRFDAFYYRDRSRDASQYLVFGLGIYRPEVRAGGANTSFPGENLEISAGLGAELFIGESWGLDIGGRAIAYFGDGISVEDEITQAVDPYPSDISLGLRGQAALFFYLLR